MVAASGIGLSTNPGQFAYGALGIFMLPLTAEFGWSRTEVSIALTAFTVALAFSLPVVGRLADRHGGRRVLLPSVIVFALLLLSVPFLVTQAWHLWLLFLLMGSLAAGANAMPYFRILAAWFDRRRGLAFGLAMAGGGFGYAYVPPLLQWLIGEWGWRSGYYVLSAMVLLLSAPIAAWILRDTPQEMGLLPDGAESAVVAGAHGAAPAAVEHPVAGRRIFVTLLGMFAALSLALYGFLTSLVPMLVDRGAAPGAAAWMAALLGVSILVSRGIVGYLIDLWFAPCVAAGCFAMSACGLMLFLAGTAGGALAVVATCLVGLSIGAEIDLLALLTTRYFGMRRFGWNYGVMFAAFLLGTATGPLAYAAVYDASGRYDLALGSAAILVLGCAAAMLTLPDYRTPHA